MSRVRVAAVLVTLLLTGVGCRNSGGPPPGVDQRVDVIESTLDSIEGELAGD